MTSVFDGMAGVLNQVFGAPVTIIDRAGVSSAIQAVFREVPLDMSTADGRSVLDIMPTLRVLRSDVPRLAKGYQVRVADGRKFKVLRAVQTISPASDAFVLYEMELC